MKWKIYGNRTIARRLAPVEQVAVLETDFKLGPNDQLCVYQGGDCLDVMTRGTERTSGGANWIRRLLSAKNPPAVVVVDDRPFELALDFETTGPLGDPEYRELVSKLQFNPMQAAGLAAMLKRNPVLSLSDLCAYLEKRIKPIVESHQDAISGGGTFLSQAARDIMEKELAAIGLSVTEYNLTSPEDEESFEQMEEAAKRRARERWKMQVARSMPDTHRLYELHFSRIELLSRIVDDDEQAETRKRKLIEDKASLGRRFKGFTTEQHELARKRARLDEEAEGLEFERRSLDEKWREVEESRTRLKGELVSAEGSLSEIEQSFSKVESELAGAESGREEIAEELAELERSCEALEEGTEALDEKIAKVRELECEHSARSEEVAASRRVYEDQLSELEHERESLTAELAELDRLEEGLAEEGEKLREREDKYEASLALSEEGARKLEERKGRIAELVLELEAASDNEDVDEAVEESEQGAEQKDEQEAQADREELDLDLARRRSELEEREEGFSGRREELDEKRALHREAMEAFLAQEAQVIALRSSLMRDRNALEREQETYSGKAGEESTASPNAERENGEQGAATDVVAEQLVELEKEGEALGAEASRIEGEETELAASEEALKAEEQRLVDEEAKLSELESELSRDIDDNSKALESLSAEEAALAEGDEVEAEPEIINGEEGEEPQIEEADEALSELEEERTKLASDEQKLDEVRKQLEEGEATIEESREEIRLGQERLASEKVRLEELDSDLKERERALEATDEELREKEDELARLGDELSAEKGELVALEDERGSEKARLADAKAHLLEREKSLDSDKERLLGDRDELRTRREELEREREAMTGELESLEGGSPREESEREAVAERGREVEERRRSVEEGLSALEELKFELESERGRLNEEERELADGGKRLTKADRQLLLCAALGAKILENSELSEAQIKGLLGNVKEKTQALKLELLDKKHKVEEVLKGGAPEWTPRQRSDAQQEGAAYFLGAGEWDDGHGDDMAFDFYNGKEREPIRSAEHAEAKPAKKQPSSSAANERSYAPSALNGGEKDSGGNKKGEGAPSLNLGVAGAMQTVSSRCPHCMAPINPLSGATSCTNCGREF